MIKKLITCSLLLFFVTACANQATFVSTPPGAQVFVDGDCIGVTPCMYKYKSNTGKDYEVVIDKDGYDRIHDEVQADQVDQPARKKWLAAGVIWTPLWLGAFFTKKLKDLYQYTLKKSDPIMNAQATHSAQEQIF